MESAAASTSGKGLEGRAGLTPFEQQVLGRIDPLETVEFLRQLIQKRSDAPPGDTRAAIQVVQRKLAEARVPSRVYQRREHQPSLVARLGQAAGPASLLLHAHIDTVPAGDPARWSVDPFGGEVRSGRIYGRGAGDDKGSLAAQVMALVTLARAGYRPQSALELAAVADEETSAEYGTVWLRETGVLRPSALMVGEQTDNRVAIAERVGCGIDLTVYGKSTHGAMPWAGENAILKAAGAIHWLRQNLLPELAGRSHPYLPPPTLNIGRISGGIQWNIVPDVCKVEMDRRLLPGETREAAVAEIRAALEAYSSQVEPLRFDLYSGGEVAANINTPPGDPFVVAAAQALNDLTGEVRPLSGYAQTSDGRWFARDGIPIILFGPGDPSLAHSPDEYITADQLVEATRFLTLFAMRSIGVD
jgi:acetylornithine deacetylase/succinyl-diaminopimelate desuccinylase family protein